MNHLLYNSCLRYFVTLCSSAAMFASGCGTTLDAVRPVAPAYDDVPETVWPDYVETVDRELLDAAERNIASARQGELLVTVLGYDQFPAHAVEVSWTQVEHQFSFGVSGPFNASVAADLIRAGVNRGDAALGWASVEPERDEWTITETMSKWGGQILTEMGLRMVASDVLRAATAVLPDEILRLSPEAYLVAAQRHVRELASRLKGRISLWEAVSEANLAGGGLLSEVDHVVRLAQRSVEAFHEVDPATPVAVSFRTALDENEVMTPISMLSRLDAAGVDYDRIGLRIFSNGYDLDGSLQPRQSLTEFSNALDELSQFDRPVDILGFAVPGQPSAYEPEVAGHWGRRWSPELQAVYYRAALILAFSKPQVIGMTWTGALDATSSLPGGGLFTAPTLPKPAFHALVDQITAWTTTGSGEVNSDGQIRFRGYGGMYRVTVRDPLTGRSVVKVVRVRERQLHSLTVVLPEELTYRPVSG